MRDRGADVRQLVQEERHCRGMSGRCGEEGVTERGQVLSGNNPGKRTRKETRERKNRSGETVACWLFSF